MSTTASSSYEEVPYKGFALFLTHPDHLAALARLFGVVTPDVETCRVLELGCARGDNLIPMALSLPRARFVGIDLSPRQIAEGRATIAELGLENIELREQNIMDAGPELGRFDFIVAHGVYSWVPAAVQEAMLRLCGRALAPNGLAYISYNAYPGWHMRTMVRDMMFFLARGVAETRARVSAGGTFMRQLAELLAKHDNAYARCLREEAEQIVRHDESYLAHEYLEETNHPIYFHEFADRAAVHGLHYLTDAQYWSMAAAQPDELFRAFGDRALDWHDREQIYDFIKGRAFRNALLCREEVPCSRVPSARAIMSLRITSMVRPAASDVALRPDGGEDFHNLRGEFALSTNDPCVRTALRILDEARPRSVHFETLWDRIEERLPSAFAAAGPDDRRAASPAALAESLLDTFAHNLIELHVREPRFTTEIAEFPEASPVARRQAAATAPRVANLRHRLIALVDFDQVVLAQLDGRHDRPAILAKMKDAVRDGVLNIQFRGSPVTDPTEAEPVLVRLLEESLRRLAAGALLVG